jgi:hypothetical protein
MSEPSLEERLAALESRVAALENATLGRPPSRDAWKSVIGMFADDPEIELIHAEARRIREEDRAKARAEFDAQDHGTDGAPE